MYIAPVELIGLASVSWKLIWLLLAQKQKISRLAIKLSGWVSNITVVMLIFYMQSKGTYQPTAHWKHASFFAQHNSHSLPVQLSSLPETKLKFTHHHFDNVKSRRLSLMCIEGAFQAWQFGWEWCNAALLQTNQLISSLFSNQSRHLAIASHNSCMLF